VTHLEKRLTQQQGRRMTTVRRPKADVVWLSKEDSEYVVGNLKPGELYTVGSVNRINMEIDL
jgi:hypothetical protein